MRIVVFLFFVYMAFIAVSIVSVREDKCDHCFDHLKTKTVGEQ